MAKSEFGGGGPRIAWDVWVTQAQEVRRTGHEVILLIRDVFCQPSGCFAIQTFQATSGPTKQSSRLGHHDLGKLAATYATFGSAASVAQMRQLRPPSE